MKKYLVPIICVVLALGIFLVFHNPPRLLGGIDPTSTDTPKDQPTELVTESVSVPFEVGEGVDYYRSNLIMTQTEYEASTPESRKQTEVDRWEKWKAFRDEQSKPKPTPTKEEIQAQIDADIQQIKDLQDEINTLQKQL